MAKKTRAKVEKSASAIAYELLEIRQQMNQLKVLDKALSADLKARIKGGESQEYYQLRKDMTLAISDVEAAGIWAAEHNCLKVDVPSVDKFLKSNRLAIPPGFGLKETEKLVEIRENEIAQEEFIITG